MQKLDSLKHATHINACELDFVNHQINKVLVRMD